MKKVMTSLIICLIPYILLSYTYPGASIDGDSGFNYVFYGDKNLALNAKGLGMGGVTTAINNEACNIFYNPSLLTFNKQFQVSYSLHIFYTAERLSLFMHNSFDTLSHSYVADNGTTYLDPLYIAFSTPLLFKMIYIGAGVGKYISYDYYYEDNYRSPYGIHPVIKKYIVDIKGGLNKATLSGAVNLYKLGGFFEMINAGFSLNYIFGKIEGSTSYRTNTESTNYLIQGDMLSYDTEFETESLGGITGSIGLYLNYKEILGIGFVYNFPFVVKGDLTYQSTNQKITGTREIGYPGELKFGVAYSPPNRAGATLGLEIIYCDYSQIQDTFGIDPFTGDYYALKYNKVIEYHIGVEYVVQNNIPVRFGFAYIPLYNVSDTGTVIFSGGGGYNINNFSFDIGFKISHTDFLGASTLANEGIEPVSKIVEIETGEVFLTVSYKFGKKVYRETEKEVKYYDQTYQKANEAVE